MLILTLLSKSVCCYTFLTYFLVFSPGSLATCLCHSGLKAVWETIKLITVALCCIVFCGSATGFHSLLKLSPRVEFPVLMAPRAGGISRLDLLNSLPLRQNKNKTNTKKNKNFRLRSPPQAWTEQHDPNRSLTYFITSFVPPLKNVRI